MGKVNHVAHTGENKTKKLVQKTSKGRRTDDITILK